MIEISEQDFNAWTDLVSSLATYSRFTNLKFDPIERSAKAVVENISLSASGNLKLAYVRLDVLRRDERIGGALVGSQNKCSQIFHFSFSNNDILKNSGRLRRRFVPSGISFRVSLGFLTGIPNFLGESQLREFCLKIVQRVLEIAESSTEAISTDGRDIIRSVVDFHKSKLSPPGTQVARVLPYVGKFSGSAVTFYATCHKDVASIEFIASLNGKNSKSGFAVSAKGAPPFVKLDGLLRRLQATERIYVRSGTHVDEIDELRLALIAAWDVALNRTSNERHLLSDAEIDVAFTAVRHSNYLTGLVGQIFSKDPNIVGNIEGPALVAAAGLSNASRWLLQRRFDGMIVEPIFNGRDTKPVSKQAFLMMPFSESWSVDVEAAYRDILHKYGMSVVRADDMFGQNIIEDIWKGINSSEIAIVDTTGRNPNVFYELGICHTIGKPTIMTTQDVADIPFDVRYLRHIVYENSFSGLKKLTAGLEGALKEISGPGV